MMKLQHFGIVTLCLVSLSAQSETTVISGDFLNDLRRDPVVGGGLRVFLARVRTRQRPVALILNLYFI
ncbi:hypothetical protein [Candidatus Parabeggiatoa sp. HSG14]|uniref:hypothetical protein n=1 Tax=Candidatus Parabeggiatoa sp. HSG14 TaxID=3055593 RepID=UPI0025A8DBC4|nr:hypothetical protein [Thiotrichales bacterium HSG14]